MGDGRQLATLRETREDVARLQALIDASHARMGAHMRSIVTPERTQTARQVVAYLQGVKHVALATVTDAGQPRVAPLDALFVRGRFHVGSDASSYRIRHLRRRLAVSLTHFVGDEIAITVHGRATLLERGHPDVPALEAVYVETYGSSPFGWAPQVVLVRIEPAAMYVYAPRPDAFGDA